MPDTTVYTPAINPVSFTSEAEIKRIYSSVGQQLRLDDLDEEDAASMIIELINSATETVNAYTIKYYNAEVIALSPWIRRRATIIACYYLSMRRANGTQFGMEYQRIMEELEKFLTDKPPMIPGPDGLPLPVRTSMIPTISKYIVDDRNRYRKLRVSRDYSTKNYPGQYTYGNPYTTGDYY